MDPNAVIFDISSDEDCGVFDESNDNDNLDWLSELFDGGGDDDDNVNDDSDDVVIVGEVSSSSMFQKQNLMKASDEFKLSAGKDDSDDECLILDGDPDKSVAIVNDNIDDGSDELLIVGEKGQLACRDFPHSRHLCARYPFSTSPHEKYCDLCHCYVCDTRAPCIYWGTGVSNTDHCHSTDKEEIWKLKRKSFKQGQTVQPPLYKQPEAIPSMGTLLHKSGPMLSLSQPPCGSFPLQTGPRSATLRGCSSVTSFGVPSIIGHKNNHRTGFHMSRNQISHHVNISRSPTMVARRSIRRDRNTSTLSPHFVSPNVNFKRAGTAGVGVSIKNRSGYGSSSNGHTYKLQPSSSSNGHTYKLQPMRVSLPPVARHDDVQNQRFQDLFGATNSELGTCQSFSQPNIFTDPSYTNPAPPPPPPPVHSSQPNHYQNMYPYEYSASTATSINPPEFDLSWLTNTTENLNSSAETSQIPSVQPTQGQPSHVTETISPCTGSSSPDLPEFNLDNWMNPLDNQLGLAGAANDLPPSAINFVPGQPDMIDEGLLLFDFENC